jgi:nucleoside-diphosphate-sugar epimerase
LSGLQLVTGGSGYFGAVVVARLVARGQRVRVFDLSDLPGRPDTVEFLQGDIRDRDAVEAACRDVEVAYHNVALVPVAKDAAAFWTVNRDGTRNLLAACLASGVRKVLHTSSSAIFGVPRSNPVDEQSVPEPREEYGRAKLAAESLCHDFEARGLDVSILRPRTIIGPGRLGIMQLIYEWTYQGRNLPVMGRGDNLYQFVHGDDMAEACLLASERPGSRTYNVGTEDYCSMRETLEGLVRHADTGSRVRSIPMTLATLGMDLTSKLGLSPLGAYHSLMYGRSMYFDTSRAQRELGWNSRFGNVEMFCQSYDWYVANRDELLSARGGSHHRSPVREGILSLASRIL